MKEPELELLAGRWFYMFSHDDVSSKICLELNLKDNYYIVSAGNYTYSLNVDDEEERLKVDKIYKAKADAFNFVKKFDDFFTALATYKTVYSTLQAVFQCAGDKLGEYNKRDGTYERLNDISVDEISKATFQTITPEQINATCAECLDHQNKQCSDYKLNDICDGECSSCYERRDCSSQCNECEDLQRRRRY